MKVKQHTIFGDYRDYVRKSNKYEVFINFQITCQAQKNDENAVVGIVWASIENHGTSFGNLDQFKFNERGKFGNKQTKSYLTDLASYSKKICTQNKKREGVFEGMYGFVGCYYYYLIYDWCQNNFETFHWQYLKTQQIKKNADHTYSRKNSMNFLRGNRSSKIIHHLSSIAWFSLSEFCLQHQKLGHIHLVEYILTNLGSRIDGDKFIIEEKQKKNREMIGNTPFTSLHISYWKNRKKCEPEKRNNMDVLVNVMLCFGPKDVSPENPRFWLPQKGSVPFKHDQVFIHSPQRDGILHI